MSGQSQSRCGADASGTAHVWGSQQDMPQQCRLYPVTPCKSQRISGQAATNSLAISDTRGRSMASVDSDSGARAGNLDSYGPTLPFCSASMRICWPDFRSMRSSKLPPEQVCNHFPPSQTDRVVEGAQIQCGEQGVREAERQHQRDPAYSRGAGWAQSSIRTGRPCYSTTNSSPRAYSSAQHSPSKRYCLVSPRLSQCTLPGG